MVNQYYIYICIYIYMYIYIYQILLDLAGKWQFFTVLWVRRGEAIDEDLVHGHLLRSTLRDKRGKIPVTHGCHMGNGQQKMSKPYQKLFYNVYGS